MQDVYFDFIFLLTAMEAILLYAVVLRRKFAVVKWWSFLPFACLFLAMQYQINPLLFLLLYYLTGKIFIQTGWVETIRYAFILFLLGATLELLSYQVLWSHVFELGKEYGTGEVWIHAFLVILLLLLANLVCLPKEMPFASKMALLLIPVLCMVVSGVVYAAGIVGVIEERRRTRLTLTILVLGFACVCIATMLISYTWQQRNLFRKQAVLENRYSQQQKAYFELLLKKEEETKRFRHDMVNQFICLQEYMKNGQYEDVENYLQDILKEMDAIRETQYDIGNEVVNVLLNYYFVPIKNRCTISVEGYLGGLNRISQMDLCTIFSNLFKNAADAVGSEGSIKMRIVRKEKFAQIVLGNTIGKAVRLSKEGRLLTTKADKENHGFGVGNIKRTVKKYNGEYQYRIDENWFEIEIILPV